MMGGLFVVTLVVGLAYFGGGADGGGDGAGGRRTAIATIGNQVIALEKVENLFSSQSQRFSQIEDGLTPETTAQTYAQIVVGLASQALLADISDGMGVQVSDQQIVDEEMKTFEAQIAAIKSQMIAQKTLKPDASEQEFQAVLKKEYGGDTAELRRDAQDKIGVALKDPLGRDELISRHLQPMLRAAIAKSIRPSDDDLKKGFQTWVTKRVHLDFSKHQGEDLRPKMDRIHAEIKAGLPFEQAMEKYSDDPKPQGKRKSEATVNLAWSTLTFDDSFEPIRTMKAGELSPVIWTSTGPAVFKVQKIEMMLPGDFEKNKQQYRETRVQELTFMELQGKMKGQRFSDRLIWESAGFRALYNWFIALTEPANATDKAKMAAAMEKIVDGAEAAAQSGGDPAGSRPAALAAFVAIEALYRDASKEKQASLAEKRIELATNVLEFTESVPLRLELVRMRITLKDHSGAGDSLLAAAQANQSPTTIGEGHYRAIAALRDKLVALPGLTPDRASGLKKELERWRADAGDALVAQAEGNQDYSAGGQSLYNDINSRIPVLQAMNALSAEQTKRIDGFLKAWREEKHKYDREVEDQKKRDEADKKKAEAEAKKAPPKPPSPGPAKP